MAGIDDSDVPESGAVFAFGKTKLAENLPNKFWVKNDEVLQVACGDEHSVLVAESGRVFDFGPNDWGQLGVGEQRMATRPTCIKSMKHEKCCLVACGRSHTVIATESGKLYSCGTNDEGQLGVERVTQSSFPAQIVSVKTTPWKMLAAGCEHSMALTETGQVYVWGSNGEGQLGLGKRRDVAIPTRLDVGRPVRWIACGYYHSALVTEAGELWTWGEKDGGKLGLGSENAESSRVPQHVQFSTGRVRTVSCGGSHTAVLTENGEVYTCGDGSSGQLGLGVSVLESESPRLLNLAFSVAQVCCGENFTALVSDRGQLYTCGDGRHGKLGLGSENTANQFTPALVDRFVHFHLDQVACGGCHMIVRARPKAQVGHRGTAQEEQMVEENLDDEHIGRHDTKDVHSYGRRLEKVRNVPVITSEMRQMDLHNSEKMRSTQRERQDHGVERDTYEESLHFKARCEGPYRREMECCTRDDLKGQGSQDRTMTEREIVKPKKKSRLCAVL